MIMRSLMAFAAVLGFGVTFLGLMLGLVDPYHSFVLIAFFFWAIVYATQEVKI